MEKDKDLYKPLPNNECIKLTIEKSKVHGLGLFTQLFVPRGVKFGVSHIKIKNELIRTHLGGFINHSDNPNCKKIPLQDENYIKYNLVAIKDITGGDELTVKYTFYNVGSNGTNLHSLTSKVSPTESEKLQEDLEPIVNAPMMEKE